MKAFIISFCLSPFHKLQICLKLNTGIFKTLFKINKWNEHLLNEQETIHANIFLLPTILRQVISQRTISETPLPGLSIRSILYMDIIDHVVAAPGPLAPHVQNWQKGGRSKNRSLRQSHWTPLNKLVTNFIPRRRGKFKATKLQYYAAISQI